MRARLPTDDVRHSELQARELRLLRRYGPIWCGSHFVFKKARFRRGFIEGVHLHLQHFLHHRRQMFALEPVRDVRLTGWFRAPADLLRRVAACAELENIEVLRIHHQGPHKSPKSDLMILLESPHWRRLRALHGTLVEFNADARRRFERLPFLRQIEELVLPSLDTYPEDPGEWFSDGGESFAEQWGQLRSLTFLYRLNVDLLRRASAMPWWDRLTKIAMDVPYYVEEPFAFLRDHLPAALGELNIDAPAMQGALNGLGPFFEQLVNVPIRALRLRSFPVEAEALGRLLESTNHRGLPELTLANCNISEAHARVLAGASNLHYLDLSSNSTFDAPAARALFSSQSLRSLVHLDLGYTKMGQEGALALAAAPGWDHLRSLNVSETRLGGIGLQALLATPNLQNLNWLSVSDRWGRHEPALEVSPDMARSIVQLPHLAHLELNVRYMDSQTGQVLDNSTAVAWQLISHGDEDDQSWRAIRSPEQTPPLDTATEGGFRGR
jgi:hypothetical protein